MERSLRGGAVGLGVSMSLMGCLGNPGVLGVDTDTELSTSVGSAGSMTTTESVDSGPVTLSSTTMTTADGSSTEAQGSSTTGTNDPCPVGTLLACFDSEPAICMCAQSLASVSRSTSAYVADYDDDGDQDAVVMSADDGQLTAISLTNDGAGTLVPGLGYVVPSPAERGAVETLRRAYAFDSTRVVPYEFEAGFMPSVPVSLPRVDEEAVALGDFDGDGAVDLARKTNVDSPEGDVQAIDLVYDVLAPEAVVEHHELMPHTGGDFPRLHTCDIDADGASELFDVYRGLALLDPVPMMPLLWSDSPAIFGRLYCYDLDDDGARDLIVRLITDTSNDHFIAYNNGDSTFTEAQMLPSAPFELGGVILGPMLAGRIFAGQLPVMLGIDAHDLLTQNSAVGFARQTSPRVFGPEHGTDVEQIILRSLAVIDVEGDGRDEILLSRRAPPSDSPVDLLLVRVIPMPEDR